MIVKYYRKIKKTNQVKEFHKKFNSHLH